jgi:hypothetical protein
MTPNITFYTGDQFFDNAGVYYIVINKAITYTSYPGLNKYEIIKL